MAATRIEYGTGIKGNTLKLPCKAVATASITLSGTQTIDGVSCVVGDRVLAAGNGANAGIYVVASGAWTRSLDFSIAEDVYMGIEVLINFGTIYTGARFLLTTNDPITLGSTSLTFLSIGISGSSGSSGSKGSSGSSGTSGSSGSAGSSGTNGATGTSGSSSSAGSSGTSVLVAGFIEEICFNDIGTGIGNNTYTLDLYAEYGYTINELKIISTSGTCTAAIQINGTNVTGISAVSVSSSIATGTASGSNTVSSSNTVTLVISSASSLNNLQATVKITRT